jgi:putative DNA primase/helicase
LRDVRDAASKAADSAARLACLLHVFAYGPGGSIGLASFEPAARITAWHLSESRRFFNEVALPVELADASRLDRWLLSHAARLGIASIPTKEAQRLGPIRDRERINSAMEVLDELNRARLVRLERRRLIFINPALLEG